MKSSHLVLTVGLAALPVYGVAAEPTTEAPEASATRAEMNAGSEMNADGDGEAIFVFGRRDASGSAEDDVAVNDDQQSASDGDRLQGQAEARETARADHARVRQLRSQARQKAISLREGIQARVQAIRAQMSERLQAARAEARERAQAIRAEIRD